MWKPLAIIALLHLAQKYLGRPEEEYAQAIRGLSLKFAEWDASKHPRGHEGNPGEFAKKGTGTAKPAPKETDWQKHDRERLEEIHKEYRRAKNTPANRKKFEESLKPLKQLWKEGNTDAFVAHLASLSESRLDPFAKTLGVRKALQFVTKGKLPRKKLRAGFPKRLKEGFEAAQDFLRGLVPASNVEIRKRWRRLDIVHAEQKEGTAAHYTVRARYSKGKLIPLKDQPGRISLSTNLKLLVPETVIHEIGHMIEKVPGVVAAEMEFRKRRIRAAGRNLVMSSRGDILAQVDFNKYLSSFEAAYAGKLYKQH
jgi:hypothetical protein